MDKVQQRISEGEDLLNTVKSLKKDGKALPGSSKLANRIRSEIRFLSKVLSEKLALKPCHITSTNLSSLATLVQVVTDVGIENITEILPVYKDDFENSICVDIVAGEGHYWIKVVARAASALNSSWKGRGQFGERSLINVANNYLRTAQSNPIDFKIPKVVFYFLNGVPVGLAKDLTVLGLLVDGELISCFDDDLPSDEEDNNGLENSVTTVKLGELFSSCNLQSLNSEQVYAEISKANLDVSTMLTLVSNLSNSFDQFFYGVPVLDEQAKQERQEKVLPKLEKFLEKKTLIACKSAVDNFQKIINTIGGEKEKERTEKLMKSLVVVPDNLSSRTTRLITSSKLNKRAKTVFGTGDSERAITVTANTGFVRAALQNGVRYSVFEHEPRALTELKEKSKINLTTKT